MSLKKYLSKNLIMRVCLLLLMVGAAALFDMYHGEHNIHGTTAHKTPQSQEPGTKTFFCNQVPSYNLKTTTTELSVRFRNGYTQDKFLLRHYNLRTFQLMKAEAVQASFSAICSFHSLPFNRVVYSNPDDTPPLS